MYNEDNYLICLIKVFNNKVYCEDFINKGLYMKNISETRKKNDLTDGAEFVGTFNILDKPVRIIGTSIPSSLMPVFSMFCYFSKRKFSGNRSIQLTKKQIKYLKQFGNFAVIVFDVHTFIKRIYENNKDIKINFCNYYIEDNKNNIKDPLFYKKNIFEPESELRIICNKILIPFQNSNFINDFDKNIFEDFNITDEDHYIMSLNTKDISQQCSICDLFKGIKINIKFDKNKNKIKNLFPLK